MSDPRFQYPQGLSLSPDFATDRALAAPAGLKLAWRSTDAGDTWQEWAPRIAFTSDRGGSRDIYTMDQDGSDVRRLTDDPAAEEAPAWSPAWTRIAYQSDRNGNWDIFTTKSDCDPARPEAGEPCDGRQLTDGPGDDMLPAWSPDGRSIAFVSTRDGNPEIYVMDKDGGNQRRLTFNPTGDWRPAWMPDSRHLVFTSDRGGSNDIYALEAPPPDAPAPGSEMGLTPVVTGPADDRDPAVNGQSALLFLSDRDGVMRSYRKDLRYPESGVYPVAETSRPEGHPAWIEDSAGGSILVSVEGGSATNIYRAGYPSSYTPLTGLAWLQRAPGLGPGLVAARCRDEPGATGAVRVRPGAQKSGVLPTPRVRWPSPGAGGRTLVCSRSALRHTRESGCTVAELRGVRTLDFRQNVRE